MTNANYSPPEVVVPTPGGAPGDGIMLGTLTVQSNIITPPSLPVPAISFGASKIPLIQGDNMGGLLGAVIGSNNNPTQIRGAPIYLGNNFATAIEANGLPSSIQGNSTAGLGWVIIRGLDNRQGVTVPDSSPITLYTTTAAGQVYKLSLRLNATAYTSGTATYTLKWTENGIALSLAVSTAAASTPSSSSTLIQPDNGTAITVQLAGTFVATLNMASVVEQVA